MSPLWFVAMPLLVAYASALWWCVELWSLPEGYFAHGPLVPAVMAYVVWARRSEWRKVAAVPDVRGFWLLGPALLLHLGGAALSIDAVSAASLVLAIPGAAWVAVGRARLVGLWPALWMFAFAAPLPIYVTDRIAFELKEVAVPGGVWLAQATGLGIERDGASLLVEGQTQALDVADPCGGLRSLLAMITLVYCVAFFLGPPQALRRIVLMLVAAPIAVLVNVVRIAAICWLAKGYDVPFATGTGHDVMNGIAWILDLALVLSLDALLTRRSGHGDGTAVAPMPIAKPARTLRLPRVGAWMWPLCLCLCLLSFTRAEPSLSGRARALPTVLTPFTSMSEREVTPRMHQLLGTDDAAWRNYEDDQGRRLFVVAVFHGSNWKSVHPPHICLLGSDMSIEQEGGTDLASRDGDRAGQILLRTKKDGRPYVSLYAYGASDLCTGSYLKFFLHHAPRALFRASNDGFLLRVEAYADGPGGFDAAEARCRELLEKLVLEARKLLP